MTDGAQNTGSVPHHNRLANELSGSWKMMTGHAEMATGAQFDNPELYFNGVVDALEGRLRVAIGDQQAKTAGEALRMRWAGLNEETKGKILKQWGDWTGNPATMADGVVDLMQGKLDRYLGASQRQSGKDAADLGIALGDAAADAARRALTNLFAQPTT